MMSLVLCNLLVPGCHILYTSAPELWLNPTIIHTVPLSLILGVDHLLVFTTPSSPQLLTFVSNYGLLLKKCSYIVACFPYMTITDNPLSKVSFLYYSLYTLYLIFVRTLEWCIKDLPIYTSIVKANSAR